MTDFNFNNAMSAADLLKSFKEGAKKLTSDEISVQYAAMLAGDDMIPMQKAVENPEQHRSAFLDPDTIALVTASQIALEGLLEMAERRRAEAEEMLAKVNKALYSPAAGEVPPKMVDTLRDYVLKIDVAMAKERQLSNALQVRYDLCNKVLATSAKIKNEPMGRTV